MPSYSTSNQNTRVFAPHVILTQNTSRLSITITTADGLPSTGITAGDVIRYDVATSGYTLSNASTNATAEVVGVVESKSSGQCVVVVSGSMIYPSSRLNTIIDGSDGGVDVLFLNENVAGGLTGTIDLSAGGEKIVKPVFQVAPHGQYNGIVINYIGYKTGNQASQGGQLIGLVGPGTIIWSPPGTLDAGWSIIEEDLPLLVNTHAELHSLYVGISDFIERVVVIPAAGSQAISFLYPINDVQVWQTSAGIKINTGTVGGRDTLSSVVYVRKTQGTSLFDITKSLYIGGRLYTVSSTSKYQFIVPKVSSDAVLSQGDVELKPHIKLTQSSTVTIPNALVIASLEVTGNMEVGAITDLEAKIANIDNKLALLNNKVTAY